MREFGDRQILDLIQREYCQPSGVAGNGGKLRDDIGVLDVRGADDGDDAAAG